MKNIAILLALLVITSCFEEKAKEKEKPVACFDVVNTSSAPRKILINKCTGETWTLLYEEYPNTKKKGQRVGSHTYKWNRIYRYETENTFAGY